MKRNCKRVGERERERQRLPPLDSEGLIVPIVFGTDHVDIGVNPSLRGCAGAADGLADLLSQGFRRERKRGKTAAAVGVRKRAGGGGRCDATEEEDGGDRCRGTIGQEKVGRRERERRSEEEREEGVVGNGGEQQGPFGHLFFSIPFYKISRGPMLLNPHSHTHTPLPLSLSLSFFAFPSFLFLFHFFLTYYYYFYFFFFPFVFLIFPFSISLIVKNLW